METTLQERLEFRQRTTPWPALLSCAYTHHLCGNLSLTSAKWFQEVTAADGRGKKFIRIVINAISRQPLDKNSAEFKIIELSQESSLWGLPGASSQVSCDSSAGLRGGRLQDPFDISGPATS